MEAKEPNATSQEDEKVHDEDAEAHNEVQDEEFSWRKHGILLPVLRQKRRSCCAFVGTEACSSLYARKYGVHIQLSPQHIVDHLPIKFPPDNQKPDKYGCYITKLTDVFKFIQRYGVCFEEDYSYKGPRNESPPPVDVSRKFYIEDFKYLGSNHEAILQQLEEQPLGGLVQMYHSFKNHTGEEIYLGPKVGEQKMGVKHAALIIGYGKENGVEYYVLKNSWGPKWCMGGYCKIRRDLVFHVSYPIGGYIKDKAP